MWVCSHCGARSEPSFDVCWRCGTTYQGEVDPDFRTADEAPPVDDPLGYLRLEPGTLKGVGVDDELPAPPPEIVGCFESNSVTESKFVADGLLACGIAATLQNVHGGGVGLPARAFSRYPSRVVVRAEDLPRARLWVEQYRRLQDARRSAGD